MAFRKQGKVKKAENKIEVIKEETNKITASITISNITCPHCKQVIGTKIGDVYAILDKRFVKIVGQICPKCGGTL